MKLSNAWSASRPLTKRWTTSAPPIAVSWPAPTGNPFGPLRSEPSARHRRLPLGQGTPNQPSQAFPPAQCHPRLRRRQLHRGLVLQVRGHSRLDVGQRSDPVPLLDAQLQLRTFVAILRAATWGYLQDLPLQCFDAQSFSAQSNGGWLLPITMSKARGQVCYVARIWPQGSRF